MFIDSEGNSVPLNVEISSASWGDNNDIINSIVQNVTSAIDYTWAFAITSIPAGVGVGEDLVITFEVSDKKEYYIETKGLEKSQVSQVVLGGVNNRYVTKCDGVDLAYEFTAYNLDKDVTILTYTLNNLTISDASSVKVYFYTDVLGDLSISLPSTYDIEEAVSLSEGGTVITITIPKFNYQYEKIAIDFSGSNPIPASFDIFITGYKNITMSCTTPGVTLKEHTGYDFNDDGDLTEKYFVITINANTILNVEWLDNNSVLTLTFKGADNILYTIKFEKSPQYVISNYVM